jgi:mannose-6-phosphate isomerase class I
MQNNTRPYIVIPFFVEQPTWGGRYILRSKKWDSRAEFTGKKIGQSYELYSKTRLALDIVNTDDPHLIADEDGRPANINAVPVSDYAPGVALPLIKFTQAKGNSFQLHKKPDDADPNWQPKAESWYYFEPGKITFGVHPQTNMDEYKAVCKEIDHKMKELSGSVQAKQISADDARTQAQAFITEKNPWRFVNVHHVPADGVVDLSGGGLHHSWEEDTVRCPLGNVLYEVQQDVMDPVSTIRSFDQGKIMDDGTIRSIHIDDYFRHIDTNPTRNALSLKPGQDGVLFDSEHYKLKKISYTNRSEAVADGSFHHLFVKQGNITVSAGGVTVTVGEGHSCFLPEGARYTVEPREASVVLVTFL